jgi:peptide/nickel transport system substrate-binding protein
MQRRTFGAWLSLALIVELAGCARPASQGSSSPGAPGTSATTKHIVAGVFTTPAGLHQELTNPTGAPSSVPGLQELYQLVNGTLTYLDRQSDRHPWLAESVPSTDNRLWRVLPDGRMETTWRIRTGTRWHDGIPMTSDDLRFTMDVYRDRETGVLIMPELDLVEGVDVPDPQTMTVRWKQPLISADSLFGGGLSMWPLPRHLLEQPFKDNKAGFLGLSYWQGDFIGTGPYKMQDWVTGTYIVLAANDDYLLGRPKIDQIEVRFFNDRRAFVAAMLAGAVQMPLGRGLYPEDVIQVRDSSKDINVQLSGPLGNLAPVYPQFMSPDPPIVNNLSFRRALLMAIDRQEMTDTLNYGLSPVAHSWVQPDLPEGRAVESSIVRYEYDVRSAARMIEDLGYSKDADGIFRGPDGAKLSVLIRTHTQNSVHEPGTLAVARYWKDLGIDAQVEILSADAARDLQWRAEYPAFFFIVRGLRIDHPDQNFARKVIPTADNRYAGGNTGRVGSAESDGFIDRYLKTIPFPERMTALGDMVHLQTDQVQMLPLFFQGAAFVVGSNRLQNVIAGTGQAWNAHLWDLT